MQQEELTQKGLQYKYLEELAKCVGKEVSVLVEGKVKRGTCIAIHPQHLNIIVMTDSEKIIIKNPDAISRKRDKSWKK